MMRKFHNVSIVKVQTKPRLKDKGIKLKIYEQTGERGLLINRS